MMNGPLKFLTARKILPLLDLQNLNECSLACAPQIFALLASSQSNFFYFCSCSQKIRRARHARECSQRPFVTPVLNQLFLEWLRLYENFAHHITICCEALSSIL